jgi:hypothetical protein
MLPSMIKGCLPMGHGLIIVGGQLTVFDINNFACKSKLTVNSCKSILLGWPYSGLSVLPTVLFDFLQNVIKTDVLKVPITHTLSMR